MALDFNGRVTIAPLKKIITKGKGWDGKKNPGRSQRNSCDHSEEVEERIEGSPKIVEDLDLDDGEISGKTRDNSKMGGSERGHKGQIIGLLRRLKMREKGGAIRAS